MAKLPIKSGVKINAYAVLDRAVDAGIQYGWNRAHKHTATPSPQQIQDEIARAVMTEICEYFKFEDTEP